VAQETKGKGFLTVLVAVGLIYAALQFGARPGPSEPPREGDSPSQNWFKNAEDVEPDDDLPVPPEVEDQSGDRESELKFVAEWDPPGEMLIRWGVAGAAQPDITVEDGNYLGSLHDAPPGDYFMHVYPPQDWSGAIRCAILWNGQERDYDRATIPTTGHGWCEVRATVP
jgi:hypothetical protein